MKFKSILMLVSVVLLAISAAGCNPVPDLAVTGMVFDPTEPEVGSTITVTITVSNEGTARSAPSSLSVNDKPGPQVPGLDPKQTSTSSFTLSYSAPGVYSVKAVVGDSTNDPNTANNTMTTQITVRAPIVTTTYTTVAPPQGSDVGGRHGIFTYNNGSTAGAGCVINSIILTLLNQDGSPLPTPPPNNVLPGVPAGGPPQFEGGTITSPTPSSTDYGNDYTVQVTWNSQGGINAAGHWEQITYKVTGRSCTPPSGIVANQP